MRSTRSPHLPIARDPSFTVDLAINEYDEYLLKSMIRQSNHTREQFYGATKTTAKKIGVVAGK